MDAVQYGSEPWNLVNFSGGIGADTPEPDNVGQVTGQLCEIRSYDRRTNSAGRSILLKTGSQQALDYLDTSKDDEAAMVFIRTFPEQNTIIPSTKLEIKSPHIKRALRKVVKAYPDVNIGSSSHIVILGPPRVLFHYRDELASYATAHPNPAVKRHVDLCLSHMVRTLNTDMQEYMFSTELSTSDPLNPWFQHKYLWTLFRPGDLIYSRSGGVESVSKLVRITAGHSLVLAYIGCSDNICRLRERAVYLPHYDGWKALQDLSHFPLKYHKEQSQIRSKLVDRGRKYISLLGLHYRAYRREIKVDRDASQSARASTTTIDKMHLQERIILDYQKVSIKMDRDAEEFLNEDDEDEEINGKADDRGGIDTDSLISGRVAAVAKLTEDDFLICTHRLHGFSLATKSWGYFDVDHVEDIAFDMDAFESLVLPSTKKQLLLSLVESQERQGTRFDDLVKGKGMGIILLLHGASGVGKTFTAESISEHTRRPLYVLNCAELGHDAKKAEENLSEALDRAKRWDAIILVDEADVFMAERTMEHYQRNELVSVLLRALDYYQGIIILTTNRVNAIDTAFRSRVHISIAYPDLTPPSRAELWTTFITRGFPQGRPYWLDKRFLEEISQPKLNGRQIRNAVRIAHTMTVKENRTLTKEDIRTTLEVLTAFEDEFAAHLSKRTSDGLDNGRIEGSAKRVRLDRAAQQVGFERTDF